MGLEPGEEGQRTDPIDAVIEHGHEHDRPVLGHVNHPNFGRALTAEDLASIEGERFFEVYSGHRRAMNSGDGTTLGTEEMWDVALTLRLTTLDLGLLYGLATDDAHEHHGELAQSVPGRGWVHVRSRELTAEAIIEAMRAGDFYASTGVTLDDFGRRSDGSLWFEIEAEPDVTYVTEFIGTRLVDGEPGPPGEILATSTSERPEYRPVGDELYVRARVVSSVLHPNPSWWGDHETAWVQPIAGPATFDPS